MKISDNGLNLIKTFEGFSATPYICPAGKVTIGYGHVIMPNEHLTVLTNDAADQLLRHDLSWRESAVMQCVNVDINQNQFDALVSFVYNIGSGSLLKSTLLKYINQKKFKVASDEFLKWDKAHVDGKIVELAGLKKRRIAERKLFLS